MGRNVAAGNLIGILTVFSFDCLSGPMFVEIGQHPGPAPDRSGFSDPVEGEHYVLGGDGLAVAPKGVMEPEGIGRASVRHRPAFAEVADNSCGVDRIVLYELIKLGTGDLKTNSTGWRSSGRPTVPVWISL